MDFDQDTGEGRRNRTIAFSVLGLVAAGVLLGLLVGGLGLAAVRTADLAGPESDSGPTTPRSQQVEEDDTEQSESTPPEDIESTDEENERRERKPVLRTSATSVSSSDEVDLVGRFPRLGGGVGVQVQRRENGSWVDFPVTATTQDDGSFSTYVTGLRSGPNVFRMQADTGETTGRVRVEVS